MTQAGTLGFIGLGVMGEPMCRNLAKRSGRAVIAYDLNPAPIARLAQDGVGAARDVPSVAAAAEVVFLSLPDGAAVEAVCASLLEAEDAPLALVVDCSTAPVALARDLHRRFAARGIGFADAPVARTRAAAEAGTLAVMVGADEKTFAALRPLLACMASDVLHCGEVGAGQATKILNNMVLFETVIALAEALAIARAAGFDGARLFEALTQGSADSFALRNHGRKALLAGDFPERAFSCRYALKDLGYALDLAREGGVDARAAECAQGVLEAAVEAGYGDAYFPVVLKAIERAPQR